MNRYGRVESTFICSVHCCLVWSCIFSARLYPISFFFIFIFIFIFLFLIQYRMHFFRGTCAGWYCIHHGQKHRVERVEKNGNLEREFFVWPGFMASLKKQIIYVYSSFIGSIKWPERDVNKKKKKNLVLFCVGRILGFSVIDTLQITDTCREYFFNMFIYRRTTRRRRIACLLIHAQLIPNSLFLFYDGREVFFFKIRERWDWLRVFTCSLH